MIAQSKKLIKDFAANLLFHSRALSLISDKKNWQILMYHRITTPEICGYQLQPGMFVSPKSFEMQMELLQKQANVIQLDQLARLIAEEKEIKPKTIAITFDDGWRDNFDFAFPVLSRLNLPATIFLATGFIDTEKTFWSDSIPESICLLKNCSVATSALSENTFSHSTDIKRLLGSPSSSFPFELDQFITSLKQFPEQQREQLAESLSALCKKLSCAKTADRKFLSWDECRQMAKSNITFGTHTHNHLALDRLTSSEIEFELKTSLEKISANGLTASGVFCYPEGAYSEQSQAIAAQMGFSGTLPISRLSKLNSLPPLLGRVGIHNDVSASPARFAARIWGGGRF